jgi:D-alanyl-lipoteichoic acid acyltransferase DltB (MBOAT superfamily)
LLFNSLIFTIFLPLVFIIYWLLPHRWRNAFLLLASYYFYFSYNPWFLLLLIGTSAFDYWCAKQIGNTRQQRSKRIFLVLSLVSNLGVLFAFKYFVFLCNSTISIFNLPHHILNSLVIPAGLSFYTFQSLSYTIDVYRGKYKPSDTLLDFLLFVSFFPHMVAGPVVRYHTLMPQLKVETWFRNIDWGSFARLCAWGYFKKMVIADNLNLVVSPVFNDVTKYSGLELLLAGFLFVIQVYCDFSGYSDIATGVAKLFNINLSLNWRRPLFSKSLREFWTRNHISITTWFRDYLYISLGGNRVGYSRWLLNIFLVFVISGFWHGANFTFIIWGAMHGVMYIVELIINRLFPNFKAPAFFGWLYLISFHTISLIAFRANDVTDLVYIYKKIFSFAPGFTSTAGILQLQDKFYFALMFFLIFLLFLKEAEEEFELIRRNETLFHLLRPLAYILLIAMIFVIGNFSANTFIYFQF